jgi:trehalose/maltose transport system substrate-binding protein
MRKAFALLLTVAMVLSMSVFAVSAQDDMMMECPEGEADIVIASGAVGIEFEVVTEQAGRYMEMCPNVTVSLLETPDLATDRLGLYQQFWDAQSPDVDVYMVDVIWAGIIAPHVADLNEYIDASYFEAFFPAMVSGQQIDGAQVAIPWYTDAAGLYYRTDLLEEYGQAVPTTWDELAAAAQVIQDGERAKGNTDFYGYVWQGNAYEGLTCDAHEWLVSETGDTFIGTDGTVNVNNEAFIAALERAATWVGGISPEAVTTYGEEESRAVWQAGNAAFMRNWPYAWTLGNSEGSSVVDSFDYAPLPMGAAGAPAACLGGWQLAVSAYSDNVAAAASVAEFLASPAEQKGRAIVAGFNPTVPALYEDAELLAENPLFERMGPILASAFPRPSSFTAGAYNDASTLFFSAVHGVLTGSNDAQTAVEDLELDLEDLVAEITGE